MISMVARKRYYYQEATFWRARLVGMVRRKTMCYSIMLIIMDTIINFRCQSADKELLVTTARKHRINLSDLIRLVLFSNIERGDWKPGD
jgi:hypothetical protein